MLISIRERTKTNAGWDATLSFDGQGEYPITISDPFEKADEERLQWYFETHLEKPYLDKVKAADAAASVKAYGTALFKRVFADPDAYAEYKQGVQAGVNTLRFEIVGTPEFHCLHWEAMHDPNINRPLAVEAAFVRKHNEKQTLKANVRSSPTINVLVVTARSGARNDVGYRTISRPLVEALRQADVRVQIDILRPGTYEALVKHLDAKRDAQGAGYYHVIHFDTHGALLPYEKIKEGIATHSLFYKIPYARNAIQPYTGERAYLFLAGEEEGQYDPVWADDLAELLKTQQIPIAILNACQSARQVGTDDTSLGSRLMQAGVQVALAMSYSVTVSAAELLMTTLYRQLFAHADLSNAIRQARAELYSVKERRGYFNMTVALEDWLLPVVYQNSDPKLTVRDFTPDENTAYYKALAEQYDYPQTQYGFVGRDLDILNIETRLLTKRNLLLVRGMGGAGKSTLLRYLGAWWQQTRFVDKVFYFGYDEKAYTRQQILHDIARQILSDVEFVRDFQPLPLNAQQKLLTGKLRGQRHLLILDNLESITGEPLSIPNTLPPDEQAALHGLLRDLQGGKTLVLLGSRSEEAWLADGTFEDNLYDLSGLDPEAASTLADEILKRLRVEKYRADPDFQRLLKLLDGFPLALQVTLANLKQQTPTEVLTAFQGGDAAVDTSNNKDRTASILRCIDYSHSNLRPEAQDLLLCLAPFTSVLYTGGLEDYTALLKQQPALVHLPFDRWAETLQETVHWGLLTPVPEYKAFLRFQPTFPYFLRSRLHAPEQQETRKAIETAFRLYYERLGNELYQLMKSKEAQEKQIGQMLARWEYENLITALNLSLNAQVSILDIYLALSTYLNATQDQKRGLLLGEMVLPRLQNYDTETLAGPLGLEFVGVIDNIAGRQHRLRQYAEAAISYQQALSLHFANNTLNNKQKQQGSAGIYHQLGVVAQGQRQWEQAQQYYQQALQIYIEFNDRYEQAGTYHQLGMVAQGQRQWEQAQQYYQQALQIKIEFNDRYAQAGTYHQLGRVAQEQRQWEQAQQYYQQALQIKIEFNDRYAQASTYGQLGLLAQAQQQWRQAQDYLVQALSLFVEFGDQHSMGIAFRNLAWLWRESGDAELPAAVASIVNISVADVEEAFRKVISGDDAPSDGTPG